jgi:GNAT superfamily N-acetyltransferase
MIEKIAKLHIAALPHTGSSKKGVKYLAKLYKIVDKIGYIKIVKRNNNIVGVMTGVGPIILTLVVHPEWQRKGIGKELMRQLKGRQWVYTEQCSVGFYEKMEFVKIFQIGKMIFLCRK